MARPKDLPDFGKPPIAETVLSLQFEPILGLTTAHMGLLWARFRQELPSIEEHPQLPPVFESFDLPAPPQIEVTIEEKLPLPRFWFVNERKTELIQVQPNRFIHNWRKTEGMEPYPHYEPIRERFRDEVSHLESFLQDEKLGALVVNQCEVTYVNHVEPGEVWDRHGQLERVLSVWCGLANGSFLPNPEDVALRMRFVINDESGKPLGRLHVVVHPAWKKADKSPILIFNLTARGAPMGEGIEAAFAFFDIARKWIVKGFADLTRLEMHRVWERIDA